MTGDHPSVDDPSSLAGDWLMSRVIDDRLAGDQHRIDGRLSIGQVAPGRLTWEEQGRWHVAGQDREVRRSLAVVLDDDGVWWVRFDDGRPFHPWTPGSTVVHPCAPDTYTGLVSGTPDRWTVVWEVVGPAKDYRMTTTLSGRR